MNMQWIDWTMFGGFTLFLIIMAMVTKRYTRSVADFLAAGRLGGRYLMLMSQGMAGTAAISMVAGFEALYLMGFSGQFWGMAEIPMSFVLTVSGWMIYRYRETKALTVGQLFEIRYSKNFRIFMGILAWLSGIINFGIFPAVVTRFFICLAGLPATFPVFGVAVSTQAVGMLIIILMAVFFAIAGGQITVMVTDFLQSVLYSIGAVVIIGYIFWKFDWGLICEMITNRPPGHSMVNPFDTLKIEGFNIKYHFILMFGSIYGVMSWQGGQAYNSSAKNANEYRMARLLGGLRGAGFGIFVIILALTAFFVMNSQDYLHISQDVNTSFLALVICHSFIGLSASAWAKYWSYYTYIFVGLLIVITVWFVPFGIRDLKRLFADLKAAKRNDLDDGMVVDHHSIDEEMAEHDE